MTNPARVHGTLKACHQGLTGKQEPGKTSTLAALGMTLAAHTERVHPSTKAAVITDSVTMSTRQTTNSTGAAAIGMTHHITANPDTAPVIVSMPAYIADPADTPHLTGTVGPASMMLTMTGIIALADTTNLIAIVTPADTMTLTLAGIVSPADMKDMAVLLGTIAQIGMLTTGVNLKGTKGRARPQSLQTTPGSL